MKITAIELNKIRRNVYSVYINNEYVFLVHSRVLLDSGIEVGQVLSQKQIDDLTEREDFFNAIEYAELLLSYRRRSSKEIIDKLKSKGYNMDICMRILDVLKDKEFVDDEEFAVWWIKARRSKRPKGKIALMHELKSKGITGDIINEAFRKIEEDKPEDELELAWNACKPMLEKYRSLPVKIARRRLTALLKRRGFSWDTITSLTNTYFEDY